MESFEFSADEMFVLITALANLKERRAEVFGSIILEAANDLIQCSDYRGNDESTRYHSVRFATTVKEKIDRWMAIATNGDTELLAATEAFNAAEFNYFEEIEFEWPLGTGSVQQRQGKPGSKLRNAYAAYMATKARYEALVAA
jgi:hypothetical protein